MSFLFKYNLVMSCMITPSLVNSSSFGTDFLKGIASYGIIHFT